MHLPFLWFLLLGMCFMSGGCMSFGLGDHIRSRREELSSTIRFAEGEAILKARFHVGRGWKRGGTRWYAELIDEKSGIRHYVVGHEGEILDGLGGLVEDSSEPLKDDKAHDGVIVVTQGSEVLVSELSGETPCITLRPCAVNGERTFFYVHGIFNGQTIDQKLDSRISAMNGDVFVNGLKYSGLLVTIPLDVATLPIQAWDFLGAVMFAIAMSNW